MKDLPRLLCGPKREWRRAILTMSFCALFAVQHSFGQQASVSESVKTIKTYPFSDPNPVPALGISKKVAPFYPYFTFDGYTDRPVDRPWKIVRLENPYLLVEVLPEVGGKVMGAIEKSTNNEFIYLNHVMKFRAIGIRGPWTSGGIEHNFGLDLGHAPWAAAAVDYIIRVNADSSVSCVVGGLDLASRSEWRVDIRLPKDAAYFETNSLWYNPTPLHHAYLSWENAAFKASNDLQFYFPGNRHIGHDGLASPWPIDSKGRNLSLYSQNNFGGSKSYHVVGSSRNWFGGYWRDKHFGFGHWAPYTDAPGKKLWIWSLAREGAIWEHLLTDSDGQYIEAQSGAILNQAAETSGFHSPFTQFSLRPFYAESKNEYWFPVKHTEGMSDATPYGTLNIHSSGDSLYLYLSANTQLQDTVTVYDSLRTIHSFALHLQPMQTLDTILNLRGVRNFNVVVGRDKLFYSTDPEITSVHRPVVSPDTADHSAQRFFRMGEEENSMRNYRLALDYYFKCLAIEPTHYDALCRVAEYYYRNGEYALGLSYARQVLARSTYDGAANFICGNLLLRTGDLVGAEEALSLAAHSMEFRSAAYAQIAGINMCTRRFTSAAEYADRSVAFNRNNLLAYQIAIAAQRKMGNLPAADSLCRLLLDIDPLDHFADFEQYLAHPSATTLAHFTSNIRSELPWETFLELAITYVHLGLNDEALQVLDHCNDHPIVWYWKAFLKRSSSPSESLVALKKAIALPAAFVFPFRPETLPVLQWARQQDSSSWKTDYYTGLVYWNNLRMDLAKDAFAKCGQRPDFAPFYIARGLLMQQDNAATGSRADFQRALRLDSSAWRCWHYYLLDLSRDPSSQQLLAASAAAHRRFAANPIITLDHAKILLDAGKAQECLSVLQRVVVLPQEGAQEGHEIYVLAELTLALRSAKNKNYKEALRYLQASLSWPENLGAGSPYEPDNRLQDLLAGFCHEKLKDQAGAKASLNNIIKYTADTEHLGEFQHAPSQYIGAMALEKHGEQALARQYITTWKNTQDSLSRWSLSKGSDDPEFQWAWAAYSGDRRRADAIQAVLLNRPGVTRYKLFCETLQLIGGQSPRKTHKDASADSAIFSNHLFNRFE